MAMNAKNMDIAGKVALVTGGADGIGKAIVEILIQKKAKGVAIVDVSAKNGQELTSTLHKMYGEDRVLFIHCDVTNKEQLRSAFEKTKNCFGRLDIVCNNAGIFNEFKFEEMITVNLTAVVRGTYLAVEFMGTENGGNGGVVINTASSSGFHSVSLSPVYGATKHGVVGFTRNVAKEPNVRRNGIRVSAIGPGVVETKLGIELPNNVRYKRSMEKYQRKINMLQTVDVAEAVAKLIEEAQYNGCACFLSEDKKMIVVDEPKL